MKRIRDERGGETGWHIPRSKAGAIGFFVDENLRQESSRPTTAEDANLAAHLSSEGSGLGRTGGWKVKIY